MTTQRPRPFSPARFVLLLALPGLLLLAGMAAATPGERLAVLADALDEVWNRVADGPAPDLTGQALKVGVGWLPPPDTPDMRLYKEDGFELDLAEEIGAALAAPVELVRLAPEEGTQALRDGRVDLVITRAAADDPLRADAFVLDTGFRSGLSVAMRSDRPMEGWEALSGRTVCVSEANARGRKLAERLGAKVKVLRAPALALMEVRTGACDAAIHDRDLLDPLFGKMSWQKFSATLPAVEPAALVVAVAPERRDLARAARKALDGIDTPEHWRARRERWASTVSFEVYRDQVAADCH